jgi:bla regulator protein BlaR1
MIPTHFGPLANHLWQSSLFTAAVWLMTLTLRKNRAAVRHRLWLAASVKFLIPFSLLTGIGSHLPSRKPPDSAPVSTVVVAISQAFALQAFELSDVAVPSVASTPASRPVRFRATLVGLWICGFAASLGWWFLRWREIHRAVQRATSLNLDFPIRVMSCREPIEPGVLGMFRPVLLVPEGIADRLSPGQFRAVLAHELCHIRRRDNLTAAIHMFVEALFWFYPLVWWIKGRLIEEQERACDEEVLVGSDPQVYAESILKICEFCVASPLMCAPGIMGSDLKKRVREIMRNQVAQELGFSRKVLLTAATVAAVGGPIAFGVGYATDARGQAEVTIPRHAGVRTEDPGLVQVAQAQAPSSRLPAPSQNSAEVPRAFDVASVRPSDPANSGGRGGISPFPACGGGTLQIDPGRFVATNTTLYTLITWAYGIRYSCFIVNDADLLSGGPGWVLTDRFDIQATIPAGTRSYTPQQLQDAVAPELQAMLRTLLMERFKVALHRGMKEMRVYLLTVATGGPKLAPPDEDSPKRAGMGLVPDENQEILVRVAGNKASMADFTHLLEPVTHTPVLDQTGLAGDFSFDVKFAVIEPFSGALSNLVGATSPSIFAVLQGQLGLKLAPGRGSVDAWVIDHAEKPSEN